MTLDQKILDDIGESFREQGRFLLLGQAWVDRTGGVVVPGFNINAQEYVDVLRSIPFVDTVRSFDGSLTRLLCSYSRNRDEGVLALVLRHFPKGVFMLKHFLADPDYADRSLNGFGSSLSLSAVFNAWSCCGNDWTGEKVGNKGDGVDICSSLKKYNAHDFFLEQIGLLDEWKVYESSRGVPRSHRKIAKNIIEDFLGAPDYSSDSRIGYCNPLSLTQLFGVASTNSRSRRSVIGSDGVSTSLEKGRYSEEMLLQSVKLSEEWQSYQKTIGIPRKYLSVVRTVIENFLLDPDYSFSDRRHSFGSPRSLSLVLNYYDHRMNDGKGGYKNHSGPGRKAQNFFEKAGISEDVVLDSVGLRQRWEGYQKTTGLSRGARASAGMVISDFLKNPVYSNGDKYYRAGTPLNLELVLRGGPARKVYDALRMKKISESELLRAVNLEEQWVVYQKSRAIPQEHVDIVRSVLSAFLREPDYSAFSVSRGQPLSLEKVLDNYRINISGLVDPVAKKGSGSRVVDRVRKLGWSYEQLIQLSGLKSEWDEYQNSSGVSLRVRRLLRRNIESFLKSPRYNMRSKSHRPVSIHTALSNRYKINCCSMVGSGTLSEWNLSNDDILRVTGLERAWSDYQSSSYDDPFVWDDEKYGSKYCGELKRKKIRRGVLYVS